MRITQRNAILIAVACATAAAVLIYFYLLGLRPKQKEPEQAKQVEVVVPITDIAPNSVITPEMVVTKKVAASEAPKTAATRLEDVVDSVTTDRLIAQQPIKRSQVASRSTALGLTGVVPPGMRAVTVALDPVMGVAGLLKPRDRVDVVATFEIGDAIMARTVLQDVELLALGRQMMQTSSSSDPDAEEPAPAAGADAGAAKPAKPGEGTATARKSSKEPVEQPNATLAVSPLDAQRLMLADQRGELRLVLRPVGEHDIVPIPDSTIATVAGPQYAKLKAESGRAGANGGAQAAQQQPPPQPAATQPPPPGYAAPAQPAGKPAAPAKPARSVEVIRGGQREHVTP